MTTVSDPAVADTNWAGNVVFGAARRHRPTSIDELRHIVAGAERVRVLGSGHSFSPVADTTGDLVSLAGLPADVDLDTTAGTARVPGAATYADLARTLGPKGWALPAMASLPHISVAGAVATGTHGSGDANPALAASVLAVELVRSDGQLVTVRRGDADFPGAVVSVGCLGALTHLELELVPGFQVRQDVVDHVPWPALVASLDAVMASATSVSIFTDWATPRRTRIWLKSRDDRPGERDRGLDVAAALGGRPATARQHPIADLPPGSATDQLGIPGSSWERLPHFRPDAVPSAGAELQSEYLLPREHAVAALDALEPVSGDMATVLQTCELRTVAPDDQWLSPSCGRATFGLHFTWLPDTAAVLPVLARMEAALVPLGARPHWGKLHSVSPADVAAAYPQWEAARVLRTRYDPRGAFGTDYLDRYLPR